MGDKTYYIVVTMPIQCNIIYIYIYIYIYCVLSDHLSTGRKLLIYNWVYFKIKTNIWKHDIISNSRLQFPLL